MNLLQTAAVLALIASPALAIESTATPSHNIPSAQNSGAGVADQAGGKNGPTVNPRTKIANSDKTHSTTPMQDAAKIPGKPGSKSGPAVVPPGSPSGKTHKRHDD